MSGSQLQAPGFAGGWLLRAFQTAEPYAPGGHAAASVPPSKSAHPRMPGGRYRFGSLFGSIESRTGAASTSSSSTRRMRACCAMERLSLSRPRPSAVLCALARQPGALLTKHALLDEVWGHQFVSDSVLKTRHQRPAHRRSATMPAQPRFIETVSRRGYRFIAARGRRYPPIAVAAAASASRQAARRRRRSFIGRADALARLQQRLERGRAAASARWSGSPANRASARPR